jgi:glucans biosynthesis protein C
VRKLGTGRPDRLHALDNQRAVMMWLGIVLHVAVIYTVAPTILPWHDRAIHGLADALVIVIHSFLMPVFFILAGFFVALLLQKRGVRGMLRHRLRRLGLHFTVLWPPLYIACGVLGMLFMHQIAHGTWCLDRSLLAPPLAGEKSTPCTCGFCGC